MTSDRSGSVGARSARAERLVVPDLTVSPRLKGYARGQASIELILRSALAVLVEEGYRALSFRRVGEYCGLATGHINYYFHSKEDLVRALLEAVVSSYETAFDRIAENTEAGAEERLAELIDLILDDITTKKTTHIFPELWALANHDPFISDRVHEIYQRARVALDRIVKSINPDLPTDQRDALVLFMSASMEGLCIFAGHSKPWEYRMGWLKNIARFSFSRLVRDIRDVDIARR